MMNVITVGECPPQIHIKPALDVQKMENIQTCLDFLEHYGISVNGVTADGEINIVNVRVSIVVLWVGMALCGKCHFSRLCGGLVLCQLKRDY